MSIEKAKETVNEKAKEKAKEKVKEQVKETAKLKETLTVKVETTENQLGINRKTSKI
jgi:hypothetical protein